MKVEQAYAEVERITRERARNFAFGIMVLPKPKRRAIAAIYAFAREVDDTADGEAPPDEKRVRLEELHRRLDAPPSDEAMWVALADARERFPISAHALHDFVDGGLMDLERQRYESFDGLRDYCAHVAARSGVACIGVYGADQPQQAETLGIALQLINVMRDVREDWELGRVYLPQDELAAHGGDGGRHRRRRVTPAWQSLMAYQGARARTYLEDGLGCSARSTVAAPPASARSRASTARPWSGSSRAATTSSTASRTSPCRRSSGSSRIVLLRVAVVGGGLAGLSPRWSWSTGGTSRGPRGAADAGWRCRRSPSARATRRRRPTTASTSPSGFTAYQRFLARIGKAAALRREPLRLPVIDEHGRAASIGPASGSSVYSHLPLGSRLRIARVGTSNSVSDTCAAL